MVKKPKAEKKERRPVYLPISLWQEIDNVAYESNQSWAETVRNALNSIFRGGLEDVNHQDRS